MLSVAAVMSLLAFCWPLLWHPGAGLSGDAHTPLVFALLLPVVIALVMTELGNDDLDVKALAMLGVLSAVGAAVRPLGAGTAGLEAIFLLIILAGRVFGPGFGFILGNTTLLASALITSGMGPWLPFQMLAAGFVGLGAGLLPHLRGWWEIGLLAAYGVVSGFAYGWLMDLSFWPFTLGNASELSFDPTASVATNLHHFVLYNLATSMAWNAGRALSNVALVILLGPSLLRILRRSARRAAFDDA
ncbi:MULTISPECIES: ECF transporter S component [unclassified Luteococcus]|uniref:ECF transporter S component n=1 Tax=unclassified Luteococcus TaxID=2639923 RepID=UPI00313D56EC